MKYHIKKTQMVFFKLYGSKVHTKPLQTDINFSRINIYRIRVILSFIKYLIFYCYK
jgi:hypothetical protein